MRYLYLLFLLGIIASPLSAQVVVEPITPFDFATNFRDVYVDDSGNGWAVGTCNVLARTTNNGQNWELLPSPEGLDFDLVACKPGTDCQTIFLGVDNLVLRSTNGGQSWSSTEITYTAGREFHFLGDDVIVLSHGDQGYWRSTDGGDTWTENLLDFYYRDRIHFPTATTGYLFQQGGPLLKTTDAGATWDSIYQFDVNAFYGTWLNENVGFMYDQNRRIFKSTNGGSNWMLVTDTGVPGNIRRMEALSETHLVAYVFPSNIFISMDGGVTWSNNENVGESLQNGQFGLRFEGIHRLGNRFWLASWGTEILYSEDALQTATSQFPAPRPSLEKITFPTNQVGYALQERFGMMKTTDGGNTWNPITTNFYTVSRDFLVLDEQTVIIPYNSSGPQITEDGGQTWSALFPQEIQDTVYVFSIEQLPGGRLYLFGSVHGAYSDDGGQSWEVVYHELNSFPRCMLFLDDQNGFVGFDGGRLAATTNGGESWTLVTNGEFTNQPISNLFALNSTTIMNTVSGSTRCSSDGGLTWSTDACGGVTAPGEIVVGPDGAYYSGELFPSQQDLLSNIQRSLDQGQTWEPVAGFCTYAIPGAVTPDNRYLYVYQTAGFLGRVDLDAIVSTETPRSAIETAKVYPNPTHGVLQVELPQQASRAQLNLYNLQGQLVKQQVANSNMETMDLSNLPAGMYLLRVQGEGWMQSARIMVSNR
ncbi:T9SS type A sorting domain-containing protein [Lewinella sp. LCG006]|uniref:T9SS type A sorting domain-containing protein n=1 Tax=Lewinella sp. LCG006 TaxID=3231911 RepID=UPI00345F674C